MNKQNTLPPDESRAGLLRNEEPSVTGEHIQMLPLNIFFPFANHPYQIRDDPEMAETLQSVSERGVLQPILARPRQQGGYEIISGHRRLRACELAGLKEIPAIIRDMDDEEAIIVMVDSNVQREYTLPSEKAFAYKMRLDAIRRKQGILAACERKTTVEEALLGSYRGFSMGLAFDSFQKEFQIILHRQLSYPVSLGNDALGNLQRIDNLLDGLEGRLTNAKRQLETTQEEMRTAKQEAEKEFPKEQELREKAARLQELNSLLNMDERDDTVLDDNEVEAEVPEYSCVR